MIAPTGTPARIPGVRAAADGDADGDTHAGCRTCARVRMFLMVAALLIGLLGWRPAAAVALAARVPDAGTLGAGIVGVAVVVFCLRYARWRRITAR